MAPESVKALAVRTRLSESHCHPPREMREGGMGGRAMRAITAHRAWPLHADDWRSCGWWCGSGGAVALEAFNSMLWNQWWRVGHRATQAKWSKRSGWITPRRQDGAYRDGARKTRVSRLQLLHPTQPKSRCSGSEASELRRASLHHRAQAVSRRKRGVRGSGNADEHCSTATRSRHTIEASEQVEARHHPKQHIIPPTNMAASCIFCKIIKGTWKV